ncbi:MAG: NAD(P)/FAD-dependent oxidoreductase [Bacteroidales bacterium]|nr:NAD(P)/FAD-dependent oxidoreductase [Bacteroidales bacterium]
MFDAEITVIGAGVVGLAIAAKLSENNENVFVIERNKTFGQETSSRNSEVIHAGIYYPQNSLKAKLCVEGKKLLYDFCKQYEIPFNNCGKLIVASSDEEIPLLEDLKKKAINNRVVDIRFLSNNEIQDLEPNIKAVGALISPSTGIVDSHSLMKQLETNAANQGAQFVYGAEILNIEKIENGYEIFLNDSDKQQFSFKTRKIVNSAGLESDKISEMVGFVKKSLKITFCKGNYFRVNPPKNKLVKHLVYPVPNPNMEGIGIHVTIDMGGGVKLGPDVQWMSENIYDYKVDHTQQKAFFESAKQFLPFLEYDDLTAEMAGIRPKIQKPGEPIRDFYIKEESENGFPGFVNLIGIESPGLTSSLAIANYVSKLI